MCLDFFIREKKCFFNFNTDFRTESNVQNIFGLKVSIENKSTVNRALFTLYSEYNHPKQMDIYRMQHVNSMCCKLEMCI